MSTVISLLRGVNVGGHHKIKMDALRAMHESLGHRRVRTCIQSGNVVFQTSARVMPRLAAEIGDAIERSFGFRCDVVLRSAAELRQVVARNPFAGRAGLDAAKLAVTFLPFEPAADARARLAAIPVAPEELHLLGREMYIYFPDGQGNTKLPFAAIAKALGAPGTARNWNTVTRLLEMAELPAGS